MEPALQVQLVGSSSNPLGDLERSNPAGVLACGFQVASGSWWRVALAVQLRSPTGDGEHHSTSFWYSYAFASCFRASSTMAFTCVATSWAPTCDSVPTIKSTGRRGISLKPLERVASQCCQKQQYSTQAPRPLPPHTKLQVASYAQQAYT